MISDYPTVTTPDVAGELLLSQSGSYKAMPVSDELQAVKW